MGHKTRKLLPLPWRVVGNALLLALLLAVLAGALCFPGWKLNQELRAAMEADGEPGMGQLLWQGKGGSHYDNGLWSVVRQGVGKLYLGRLAAYEGEPHISVYSGPLPQEPGVTLLVNGTALLSGSGYAGQLMGVSLPEETAGGRLTVTLGPEVVRETEGVWDQGLLLFAPPLQWVEYEWGLKKDGILPYHTGTLADRPYTLTLWDETGTVISETSGTLTSIWKG